MKSTRAEWTKRVRRWERSGLTLREFAEREGLSAKNLGWWRWRLAKDGEVQAPAGEDAAQPAPLSFVRLEAEPQPAAMLEVVLTNGRVVRVPPTFDSAALASLLDVVEAR